MALNDAALNIGTTAIKNAITHVSLHTGDPGAAGTSNTSTASRQAVTWGTVATGDVTSTGSINFTGGASGGAATHVGFWSASTAGTFYGSQALTGDSTFNSAGEYTVTGLTLNSSAS